MKRRLEKQEHFQEKNKQKLYLKENIVSGGKGLLCQIEMSTQKTGGKKGRGKNFANPRRK